MKFLICFGFLLLAQHIAGKSPYFSKETEEIDSSEHGGPPGPKGTTCQCGWANKGSKRIVGGTETAVNEYPFIVALVDRLRQPFCGGSILTPYHVLTAAHCTIKFIKRNLWMSVAIGEHDVSRFDDTMHYQLIKVQKMLPHPDYNDDTLAHDISILLLEHEMRFNQFVGPICLSPIRMNLDNEHVKVIGWGKTIFNASTTSKVLNELTVRVVPLEKCATRYSEKYLDLKRKAQICTHRPDKASCQGDSGGPLVWLDPETNRYTQVGIVSFGRICGDLDPSVFTYPTAYWDWIQNTIKESTPAGKNLEICRKR